MTKKENKKSAKKKAVAHKKEEQESLVPRILDLSNEGAAAARTGP